MNSQKNRWMYILLGLMLFSLVIFSGLPLVSSLVAENTLLSENDSEPIKAIAKPERAKLEAEATGYQKILAKEPQNETAWRELLKVRLQQQDISQTIEPLEQLFQFHPEQTEYAILLAQTKQYLADYEGAAAAYRQVLAANPGNIMALGGLANLFLTQNLPTKAIALIQNTIAQGKQESEPAIDLSSVQLLLGEIYTQQEDYEAALAIFKEVAATDNTDFRPVLAQGLVLQKQGKDEVAKPLIEQAYKLAPPDFQDQIKNTYL
ncbi:MAG TPA: tetratricopeptide repeat protein [Xenococcaceae cyanobacterium]